MSSSVVATMTRVLILSIVLGVCCASAEITEFQTTTELSTKKHSAEDRLLVNVTRAENSSQLILDMNDEEEPKKTDKKPRTVMQRDSNLDSRDNSSCCGFRHSSSGFTRPDHNYNKIPVETGRYPSQYGERHPVDRYGWQTPARPPSSTASGGGRPSGSGGTYGGSGAYSGSQSGDRYGPRPVYGSESTNRPSTLGYGSGNTGGYGYGVSGYGSYGRPSGYGGSISGGGGGYGISGTLADGDEFGPGDPVFSDGNAPHHPGNIQAQKAVALKALAGVALIGAAAALASNPVLLPIGIVAGRRKRSESFSEEERPELQMDYIVNVLKENLAKIQKNGSSNRLIVSPRCVARLTCEIQRDYLSDLNKDFEIVNTHRKQYLTNLIRNNVLNTASVSANVKNLIKLAVGVAMDDKSCDVFSCSYVRKG